jgi:HK97 gp10 family phage protein
MADVITVKVRGPDLAAAVKLINTRIEANTERSLDKVAALTEKDAKSECPVRTGALMADIKTYKAKLLRQIGNNLYYGPFVHEGTVRQRSQPYLRNAFNKNYKGFINDIKAMKV